MQWFKVLIFLYVGSFAHAIFAADGTSFFDLDGKAHRLQDYRGKWLVINYWATWCPPCREEIPELIEFHRQHQQKDAVVLGVHFDTAGVEQVRSFAKRFGINYPVILLEPNQYNDAEHALSQIGPVPGLPTTYLIDPQGVTIARQTGPVTAAMIEAFIAEKTNSAAFSTRKKRVGDDHGRADGSM